MARQIYECPSHGEFEVTMHIKADVPQTSPCPVPVGHAQWGELVTATIRCDKNGRWVPSAPNFIGGPTTGAKKE